MKIVHKCVDLAVTLARSHMCYVQLCMDVGSVTFI